MVALSLIIVECKPDIEKIRWLRLGDDRIDRHSSRWYRQCQTNRIRDFSDDEIQPCVSKLVVDTTEPTQADLLVKAVRDLILTTKGRIVDFKEWRLMHSGGSLTQQADQRRQDSKGFCRDGHCVNVYIEEGISHYVICAVCGIRVTKSGGGVYACRFCYLAIHKSCGELASKDQVSENIRRKSLRENMGISYLIPEKHLCLRCRLEGKDFSFDCASCIFHSHLRSQLAPTILNKFYKHEHILFLWVRPNMTGQYKCAACKKPGYSIAYGCMEGCNINYHLECALLPA